MKTLKVHYPKTGSVTESPEKKLGPGRDFCKPISLTGRVKLESRAYHEAGHAVVAVVLGMPLNYATIKPRPKWLGKTHCDILWETEAYGRRLRFELVKHAVTMLFGGYEAERLIDPTFFSMLCACSDFEQAVNLLPDATVFPDGRPAYIQGCKSFYDDAYYCWLDNRLADARRIVRREKKAVAALARELTRRCGETLRRKDINTIVLPLLTEASCALNRKILSAPFLRKYLRRIDFSAGESA